MARLPVGPALAQPARACWYTDTLSGPYNCARSRPVPLADHLNGITNGDGVEVPCRVVRAEVDTAVADVGVSLRVDRPGGRVHVHAAPGNTNRVVGGEQIPVRGIQRMPMVRESITTVRSLDIA